MTWRHVIVLTICFPIVFVNVAGIVVDVVVDDDDDDDEDDDDDDDDDNDDDDNDASLSWIALFLLFFGSATLERRFGIGSRVNKHTAVKLSRGS